ncbi:hypothetical protein HB364_32385 [Pseudoflavitalea sp. X16]|uniref:hypothetical protein n=1 Tax=Paraflavitalea devenefica TaxID=2716334 RepID=UPI00141E7B41|nr:hypothetical protein [Paraflavitalea devenefica]NII29821.1 hypothetical protein [Paraflavitalea devenefica]
MANIKYGIFDLFVYTLPGIFFLSCILYIQRYDLLHPHLMFDGSFFTNKVPAFQVILFIGCSYIAGFILSICGNYLLFLVQKLVAYLSLKPRKASKEPTTDPPSVKKSKMYTVVREQAKENQKYIELWNVLKNFSATLAITILILTVFFFIKFSTFGLFSLLTGIGLVILLLFKSMEYHSWAHADLKNTYENVKSVQPKP